MAKEKTEEVVLSFEDKLKKQIEHLDAELKGAEAKYHQVLGAISQAKSTLEEFNKSK